MMDGIWLDWDSDGRDWPHRSASRFITIAGIRWHVQEMGPVDAPVLLLLHGTGASSHSWRHLLPPLSATYRIVAPDLPCHGFSRPQGWPDLSLDGMTRVIQALMTALGLVPAAIIGHSAGAAIAVSLGTKPGGNAKPLVIGINSALRPIRGERVFSPMAKTLFAAPLSAQLFALMARGGWLSDNLLMATGSPIDRVGAAIYRRLLTSPGHVRGALGMMAAWDLKPLDTLLSGLSLSPVLIAAKDDPMVPYGDSKHAANVTRSASLTLVDNGGHLLHECKPDLVLTLITEALQARLANRVDAA